VRGGDFSCEAETCRGDPSCRELVGDATSWPRTGRLASVGLEIWSLKFGTGIINTLEFCYLDGVFIGGRKLTQ
jgi:hypothetical protein